MSQEVSTNIITPEPSQELIASEPWSIDTYADGLMDELFANIDSIVDVRGIPSQRIEQTPPIVKSKTQLLTISQPQKVINPPTVGKTIKKRRVKSKRSFKKLFSGLATIGLAVAGLVWVVNSGLFNIFSAKSTQQVLQLQDSQQSISTSLSQTQVEANLANYMLEALAIMDRKEAKNNSKYPQNLYAVGDTSTRTAFSYLNNSSNGNLPQPLNANNIPPVPGHGNTVVERVYIPVYQAPPPMRYAPPTIPGVLPSLNKTVENFAKISPFNNAKKPINENVLAVMRPNFFKPLAIQNKPITVPQPPKPVAAEFLPPPPPKQDFALQPPATTYRLEGVLDLGDSSHSAALFEIGGVSRRIQIGESIGTSGWTLVEVTKSEAIIRRNGEVRSVYAGQEF